MQVGGYYEDCTPAEALFLKRHHLAMTRLYAVEALQVPGVDQMTKDEFISRLKDLRIEFTWLNGNIPPRLATHLMGGYTRNLQHVEGELAPLEAQQSKSQGACYVATAVYGSYDAPEVQVLRRFRDDKLQQSMLGRAFIRGYYKASPPLARRLENATTANRLVRRSLDVLVERLDDRS